MKKSMLSIGVGLAICMLAGSAQALGLLGGYDYQLVLRNEYGLVMGMGQYSYPVSSEYTFEVYKEKWGARYSNTERYWIQQQRRI